MNALAQKTLVALLIVMGNLLTEHAILAAAINSHHISRACSVHIDENPVRLASWSDIQEELRVRLMDATDNIDQMLLFLSTTYLSSPRGLIELLNTYSFHIGANRTQEFGNRAVAMATIYGDIQTILHHLHYTRTFITGSHASDQSLRRNIRETENTLRRSTCTLLRGLLSANGRLSDIDVSTQLSSVYLTSLGPGYELLRTTQALYVLLREARQIVTGGDGEFGLNIGPVLAL